MSSSTTSCQNNMHLVQCHECGKFLVCGPKDSKKLIKHARKEHGRCTERSSSTECCTMTATCSPNADLPHEDESGVNECEENEEPTPKKVTFIADSHCTEKARKRYIKTLLRWRPNRRTRVFCPSCRSNERPLVTTYVKYFTKHPCVVACLKLCTPCHCLCPCFCITTCDKLMCCSCDMVLAIYKRKEMKFIVSKRYC